MNESSSHTITVQIPEEWLGELPLTRDQLLQEIFELGLEQWRVRRALELYRAGRGSLGYLAEKLGLSKRQLIQEARARGVEPLYDEEMVLEEAGE